MFTITWRVTKRQLAAAAAVLVLTFAGGIWLRSAFSESAGQQTQASPTPMKVEKAPAKNTAERIAFLESFGWQVEGQEAEILEIKLPKQLDEVYLRYNEIQKEQGCNLEKYTGKRCKRYSYVVLNYPGQTEHVRANLLTYNGKVIGGDVSSLELDGFMHGFAPEID